MNRAMAKLHKDILRDLKAFTRPLKGVKGATWLQRSCDEIVTGRLISDEKPRLSCGAEVLLLPDVVAVTWPA
jgi:hypothetical protein